MDVRRIDKIGWHAVASNETFVDGLRVRAADRICEEGRGVRHQLHGLNPERVLVGAEGVGIGRFVFGRAAAYARERAVFTHGGYGYPAEFDVERFVGEVWITRLVSVSEQPILSHIAERALDLPKSY